MQVRDRLTTPAPRPATPRDSYKPGDRVQHAKFGEGIIISADKEGDDDIVTVVFKTGGQKELSLSYAPLEKLERPKKPARALRGDPAADDDFIHTA